MYFRILINKEVYNYFYIANLDVNVHCKVHLMKVQLKNFVEKKVMVIFDQMIIQHN
jgi:hypothetical protein